MDSNNPNPNYPNPNYPNLNNYQSPNQSSNQPHNIPNYGYPPNFFMPSNFPNYRPNFGSMMSSSPQAPPYSSTTTGNETDPNFGGAEILEFSSQLVLGGMSGVHEITPDAPNESTPARQRSTKWTTKENLVLLSGWVKYGTNSVVRRNQKGESYWSKIAEYCNEHCSFDPPRDGNSCRNHYNYVNKSLSKWVGTYDNAKRMQQSGWSEDDVLTKAHELYSSAGNGTFKYMKEWLAVRDQPRYGSKVGRNTGSGSSGSKRVRESDASDTNSVGSITRPMGRDAAKKNAKKKGKGAALEALNEEWSEFKQCKAQELERLEKIAMIQAETNRLIQEKTHAKKMKMWLKLSEKEHLDEKSKELFQKLGEDLFEK